MWKGFHPLPDEPAIDWMKLRLIGLIVSAVLIAVSVGLVAVKGLNFGIDFRGGILLEVRTDGPADLGALREQVGALGIGGITLQEFGEADLVMINVPLQEGGEDEQQDVIRAVQDRLGDAVAEYRRVEFVGPQVGDELREAGIWAVCLSLAGILLYIWFRFEWQYALAAITALLHDVVTTLGFFALIQLEFNLSTVAAVLTVAGYSINDTVVVFDRVREELRRYKSKPLLEVLNLAVNRTLSRTIITSLTTILAVFALLIFGGEVIGSFIVALAWGIVVGTYSSIFFATPMLVLFGLSADGKSGDSPAGEKSAVEATS